MKENVRVDVLGPDGTTATWNLACAQRGEEFAVTATDPAGVAWTGTGHDWFDALRALRVVLDPLGFRLLCAGARADVGQSGMLADSTQGEYVYLLKPGRSPKQTAWIFDPANAAEVASVADQEASFERWLAVPTRAGPLEPVTSLLRECWLRIRYR